MALPNYSPSGIIRMGCVPWDNSYSNVRLYNSLSEQESDISSLMTVTTSDYAYIARNRRLKVSIHADRLYHVNYCMYRNVSLTDGWIYCFVTDVEYVNDNTTELTLETDIFQTYMYGVDWTVPACFIDRMTVPSESDKYLLTPEDNFSLIYKVTDATDRWFTPKAVVIMTTEMPLENASIKEAILNPSGWYASATPSVIWKGMVNGANYYYIPIINEGVNTTNEYIQEFLEGITKAGAIESVVSIFTVPDINFDMPNTFVMPYDDGSGASWDEEDSLPAVFAQSTMPENYAENEGLIAAPARGTAVDGYTPKNRKLLYWPYTYLNLTDFNGSSYEYRYELFSNPALPRFRMRYVVNPTCEMMVYPEVYMGRYWDMDFGIVTKCGSVGSWNNNQFQTWLGQHGTALAITAAETAVGFIAGSALLASSVRAARAATALERGAATLPGGIAGATDAASAKFAADAVKLKQQAGVAAGAAGMTALNTLSNLSVQSKQPTVQRGQADFSLMFQCGLQGFHLNKMQVKAELAEQIDQYFSMFGYNVGRVEAVNLTSRPYWNYIKTIGSAAKSLNTGSSSSTPHTRGRGTPSDALATINSMLDSGCTFWHTTANFGDYSRNNSLS